MQDLQKVSGFMGDLTPSATLAIAAMAKSLKQQGMDVVSLSAGEPDFDTPEVIKRACIDALNQGKVYYTPASGLMELKQAIVEKFAADNNIKTSVNQVVIAPGAKFSVFSAIAALCGPGDEVIVPVPCRPEYRALIHASGATCVELRTRREDGFELDPGRLESAVTGRTRLLIINTPSYPAGTVYRRETLEAVAEIAAKYNFMVLADECLESFCYEPLRPHVSFASLSPEAAKRSITLGGFTAGCCMEEHPVGFVAAPEWLSGRIAALQQCISGGASAPDQHCALAALEQPEPEEFEAFRRAVAGNRERLCRRLEGLPGLEVVSPAGGLSLLCGIAGFGMASGMFCDRLLREALLEALPGRESGAEEYIGLAFACPTASLEEAAGCLAAFCGRLSRVDLNKED